MSTVQLDDDVLELATALSCEDNVVCQECGATMDPHDSKCSECEKINPLAALGLIPDGQ